MSSAPFLLLRRFLLSFLLAGLSGWSVGRAGAAPIAGATEPELKAAFLYHLANFSTWPETAFTASDQPIVLGVCNDEAVLAALTKIAEGERLHDRPLRVVEVAKNATDAACHVLFLGRKQNDRLAVWLRALQERPILLVGEGPRFAERGGAVELYLREKRLRFRINQPVVDRSRVSISSRLLRLAEDRFPKPRDNE